MENRWQIVWMVAAVAIIAAIIGYGIIREQPPVLSEEGGLKQFTSASEVRAYLAAQTPSGTGTSTWNRAVDGMVPQAVNGVAEKSAAPSLPSIGGSQDHSTTNIQVQGVDEADIVKNDGRYIYVISGGQLAIVDAYPGEKAKILSETRVNGTPVEIFLSGDRLVVFSSGQDYWPVMYKTSGMMAPRYYRSASHAYVYSVRDRSNPVLVREITFSGTYYDSRMIGDRVYVITNENVYYGMGDIPMPEVKDGAGTTIEPRVSYFDVPFDSYTFSTISSFSMTDDRSLSAGSYLLGYTSTLYVSQDNIYMAFRKTARVLAEPMVGSEVARAVRVQPSEEVTAIHRFAIRDGQIRFGASGEVAGHLLNQFSMDESAGNLRVATTVQGYGSSGSYEYNNVFVLDSGMKTVGSLKYIAPDEKIYSTRFIGDRLYMVTFKRIDPLFVIDLSDPANPGILGKLKIPGYSDYLHPYDKDHIIGLGKETEMNDWGGVSTSGLKLALFDVSDVNHPKEVDHVEIGDAGSDSEALRDHKAFLFSREKDLLVIPVRAVQKVLLKGDYSPYTQKIWQGAYAFSVSPSKGFTVRGKVTHSSEDSSGYYWGSRDAVKRSLYIGDVLYTLSSAEIIATDLATMNPIREIPLPYGGYGYQYAVPMVE